ncbi:V-type ATP synthase subunit H, partial [Halobacteriales archaeon QH_3_68_24]
DAEATERVENAREGIDEDRQRILEEGREERSGLEERAEQRREAVVEYVVSQFEEAVHAQT